MLFDTQSNNVRLTQTERNRIRRHAARQGYNIEPITRTEELDDALIKACSIKEIESLIQAIKAKANAPNE